MCFSPAQPQISVIIPSGRPEMVRMTIEALREQQCDPTSYEVLLVTPFAEEVKQVLSQSVRIVEVEKLYSPGRMRNIGAREALGDVLAFIDDDCVPPLEWLSHMVRRLKRSKTTGAVGCRVICGERTFMNRCADHCLFAAYQYRESRMIALGSAALVVRRQAFEEAGGFDERLLASEDWDFSLCLQEKDWDCFFDAKVEVHHYHGRGNIVSILKGAYRSGYLSGLVVQRRHCSDLSWLAKLSVSLGTPLLYWLLIVPYSLALTAAQGLDNLRNEPSAVLILPMVFLSRCSYHFGVWIRLLQDNKRSQKVLF